MKPISYEDIRIGDTIRAARVYHGVDVVMTGVVLKLRPAVLLGDGAVACIATDVFHLVNRPPQWDRVSCLTIDLLGKTVRVETRDDDVHVGILCRITHDALTGYVLTLDDGDTGIVDVSWEHTRKMEVLRS